MGILLHSIGSIVFTIEAVDSHSRYRLTRSSTSIRDLNSDKASVSPPSQRLCGCSCSGLSGSGPERIDTLATLLKPLYSFISRCGIIERSWSCVRSLLYRWLSTRARESWLNCKQNTVIPRQWCLVEFHLESLSGWWLYSYTPTKLLVRRK